MIKGVLIAIGIMLVSLLIPLVHFVAAPASPFIGGYIGISSAASYRGSPAAKSLIFGGLLGSVVLVALAIAGAVLTMFIEQTKILLAMWGGVAVITLYAASMAGLGAMFSQLKAAQQPVEAAPNDL